MKKLISFLLLTLLLYSCDDGDIIVTSFEFEDADLQSCEGSRENEFVFFKINTMLREAISFNFSDEDYSENKETPKDSPIIIELGDNQSSLIYRLFTNSINASYYCSIVPDSDVTVTNEVVATKGTAQIIVRIVNMDDNDGVDAITESGGIDPVADPDNDGVPNYLDDEPENASIGDENTMIEEGFDTDGDGIPNFIDQDDDNDNILTSAELSNGDPNDDSLRDSDKDGIPDYLEEDDDNDGILTINEDVSNTGNPRDDNTDNDDLPNFRDPDDDNDGILTVDENPDPNEDGNPEDAADTDGDGIPDYLDANNPDQDEKPEQLPILPQLKNTIITTYRTTVEIFNLEFDQNANDFAEDFFDMGFKDINESKTTDPPN